MRLPYSYVYKDIHRGLNTWTWELAQLRGPAKAAVAAAAAGVLCFSSSKEESHTESEKEKGTEYEGKRV